MPMAYANNTITMILSTAVVTRQNRFPFLVIILFFTGIILIHIICGITQWSMGHTLL